ncbi:TVG0257960 [Thermoplasma volcanium GSS1]|uniref:TVG0257960 protein n=1 Tax=Thermoplasma volcanium (strain ATCC 51530 / DSM 4299 / JCM 9571 / NBRC 15438 / GSS1) TaxID=273116 RepID=Q97C61_THEVO|nr:DUF1641 domain-containing protein [Thermoplasma volcanium]BAB59386.1 TVG0257960 [Thermoplasma volcanium GSS1]
MIKAIMEHKADVVGVATEEIYKEKNQNFLRNILTIYTLLSSIDSERLRKFMENAAKSIESADKLKAEGSLSLLKIGSQLKDPDVSAGVRVLLSVAKGFTKDEEK